MSNDVTINPNTNYTDDLLEKLSALPALEDKNPGILKIVSSDYTNIDAIENVLTYIADHPIHNGCNGIGCSPYANDAITDFQYTQELYDKTDGKQLRHYIIAFKQSCGIEYYGIHNIAYAIGYYFFRQGYQTFYGIHWNNYPGGGYHIHYAVNHVSCFDGVRYNATKDEKNNLLAYINQLPYNLAVHPVSGIF